jgi:hypothetical protein
MPLPKRPPQRQIVLSCPPICHCRFSAKQQGACELGFEAQQAAVTSFLKGSQPTGEYVEVESGKKNQHPWRLAPPVEYSFNQKQAQHLHERAQTTT